jgi:ubiquinone/menaquinone biosynthesis C-methylase UbiE
MTRKLTIEEIHQFWTEQAALHGPSHAASWSDKRVIELEIEALAERLDDGDRVLDVGCANGFSTLELAARKRVTARGLDYVPEMIEQARIQLAAAEPELLGTAEFAVGDITRLDEPSDAYDKVIVVRVIINLGTWERQVSGLRESARVLKPGGRLLLSEATVQGWQQLNRLRREWDLPEIPMPPFNEYLDQDAVIRALAPELRLVELVNFASTYYVGTRVIKPLLAQALGSSLDVADPLAEWNRWCAQLPAWGDYGTQKLFVFEKA